LLCRRDATDAGEAAVEELRVGERLATAYGGSRPIVWIGHRALNAAAHPAPEKVWPVRVSAGAFGADQPTRDLWLSPGHSVAVSGVLIPIGHLINGRSVVQVEAEEVEYFHVELDCHDIVLAEGLPAESYLDAGNRSDFANGGAFVTAHPEFAPRACDETCLRLVHEGPQVVAARALLLAQLAERGDALTTAADAHLVADGLRIAPMPLGARRFAFVLPEGCKTIELRSRTYVPAHAELANPDRRRLGLCVGRLQIDGDEMALDDATLGDAGWHEAERRDDHIDRRWTRGAAPLPAGARLVIVDLAGDGYYWREPRPCVVAGVEAA